MSDGRKRPAGVPQVSRSLLSGPRAKGAIFARSAEDGSRAPSQAMGR